MRSGKVSNGGTGRVRTGTDQAAAVAGNYASARCRGDPPAALPAISPLPLPATSSGSYLWVISKG